MKISKIETRLKANRAKKVELDHSVTQDDIDRAYELKEKYHWDDVETKPNPIKHQVYIKLNIWNMTH